MKFSRRNFLRSFSLAAGGLWLPGARAQQFGGFTIPYLGGGLDTVWNGINAYWKLEEATGAIRVDSTGNGNHLVDTSAGITQAAGLIGNGGTSAGGAQCLEIADNAFVGAGPGVSFSLSTWVKSSGTANAAIAGKWASADIVGGQPLMDWVIGLNGGNNLVVDLHGPGYFDTGIIYGGSLNNTWQHLCITFQAGTHVCKRYLNGSLVGTTTEIDDVQRGTGSFALFNYGQVHAAGIVGSMDETGLWGRALSAAEVAHLYNGGAGLAYPGSASGPTMAGKWALQVGLNGGAAPSAGTVAGIDVLWNGIVSDGLDGKILALNAGATDSLIAFQTPFIQGLGLSLWTNHGFVAGDLTINGLKGDGATKYLETGLVPSAVFPSASDGGLTIYASANDTNAAEIDAGVQQGATQASALYGNYAGTTYFDFCAVTNGSGRIMAVNTSFLGYISGNRGALDSSHTMAIYTGNSGAGHATLVSSNSSAGGSLPSLPLYAFAANFSGVLTAPTAKRLSFIAANKGLTTAQSAAFYARVQAYLVARGGGFV